MTVVGVAEAPADGGVGETTGDVLQHLVLALGERTVGSRRSAARPSAVAARTNALSTSVLPRWVAASEDPWVQGHRAETRGSFIRTPVGL